MSLSVTGAHVYVVFFCLVYPFVGAGTCSWFVDNAGYGRGSIMQGTVGLL